MKHYLPALAFLTLALGAGSAAEPRSVLAGHKAAVCCAAFSPDGKLLATGSFDGTVRGWDVATGREVFTLSGHGAGVRAIVFSADGKTLYSGSEDRTVRAWNVKEGKETATLLKGERQVYCLARTPDGKRLAVGVGDSQKEVPGEMKLLDLATGKEVTAPQRFHRDPWGLVFSPNGKTLAGVDGSGTVWLWDAANGGRIGYLVARSPGRSAAFDGDGTTFATGYLDGSVRLWDTASWEEDAVLRGHKDLVFGVSFSPDGQLLASASKDGTVRLWNVNRPQKEPLTLPGHGGPVWFALFAPDGKTLATGGEDHKVRLWETAPLRALVLRPAKPETPEPVKPAAGPARIALVAAEKGEAIQTLLALAEVKLTESKTLEVLDRRTIDRVLTEQKLTLSGLVAADQALAAGKLLSVDLLAVLETSPGSKQATGLVVFDARTGVKLWDSALPTRLGQAVEATVGGVETAWRKHQQHFQGLRTLCLLTVRNADLPRGLDPLCDSVGMLLERSLLASPGVAVLERRRLEQVNKERTLPTDATLQQLLASVVVCELEIARTEDGKGLKATAQLTTAQGKVIARPSAQVDGRNAGDLAQVLLGAVAKALQTAPAGDEGNRSREARRFGREAEFFLEHKDFTRALRAGEAAHALDPADSTLRAGLARALIDQAIEAIDPGGQNVVGSLIRKVKPEALELSAELAARGADLLLDVQTNLPEHPLRPSGNVHVAVATNALRNYEYKVRSLPAEQKSAFQSQLDAVSSQQRQLVELKLARAREAVKDRRSFQEYTDHVSGWVTQYGMPRDGKTADPLPVLSGWLEAARRYETADSFTGYWLLHNLTWQFRYKPKLPPALYEQYRKVWDLMAQNALPQVRLTGQLGRIAQDLEHNLSPEEGLARIRAFRLLVQKEFDTDAARKSEGLRVNLYYAAYSATELLINRPGHQDELVALCDFMLARKEVINSIAQSTAFTLMSRRTTADGRRALGFADRTLAVLASPDGRFLNPGAAPPQVELSRKRLVLDLNRMREDVVRANPELAGPPAKPWKEAEEVLDLRRTRNGLLWVFKPLVHEGIVYAAVAGAEKESEKQYVQLLRYDPDRGDKALGKKFFVETGYKPWTDDLPWSTYFGQGACIHDKAYFLATRNRGILRFSLDGDSVEQIDTGSGLPSNWVRSVAGIGSGLYAGLGEPGKEGYLVRYDLQEKKCDILASSRRKEQRSPFDDASPLEVPYLVADPPRGRLLFTAFVKSRMRVNGLWELEAKTGKFRLLQPLSLLIEGDAWGGSPVHGDTILVATAHGTFTFDLAKDQARLLYAPHTIVDCGPGLPTSILRVHERGPLTPLTDGSLNLGRPFLVAGGWFWAARPFTRVSLDGRTRQRLASPRPADRYFEPWEGLDVLADGKRLVVSDPFGLWVLRLSDDK
jgi:WD40 repeat protein